MNSDSSIAKEELKIENKDIAVLQNSCKQELDIVKVVNEEPKKMPILVIPVTGFKGLAVKLFFEYLQDEEISKTKYFEWADTFLEMLLIADYYGIETNLDDLFKEQTWTKNMFTFDMEDIFNVLSRKSNNANYF